MKRNDDRLQEARSAVGFMAEMKDQERFRVEEVMAYNTRELTLPLLRKLKSSSLSREQLDTVTLLESILSDMVSDFSFKLNSPALGLTPQELIIAGMIKDGLSTKELAARLNLAPSTIEFHRHNLRRKLNITNKRVNLQTMLRSLSDQP